MAEGASVTVKELREYLGADDDREDEIAALRASAAEYIRRATGIDWEARRDVETYNEAVRVRVWLSYYAVRDTAKNTQFLSEYLGGLLCTLQLSGEEPE